jgi:HPr Serine kinase C-terminal domain
MADPDKGLREMRVELSRTLSGPSLVDGYGPIEHDAPALTLEQMFFPLGFPLRVRTNSHEVLRQCDAKWGVFEPRTHGKPIEANIHVIQCDSLECPPATRCHFMGNVLVVVADAHNVCTAEFPWGKTRMLVSTAALRYSHYFNQTFLGAAAAGQLYTRFVTPVHAACVVLDGCGVLLCGDSGAGKTSLAWACARSGWQFVADDTSYLLHGESGRRVIGNCHKVRFRPSAAEIFPEIADAELTPRMSGKPSVEIRTASMQGVRTADNAHVDYVVYLNRRYPDSFDLVPYSRDVARRSMRQVLFGTPDTRGSQYEAIERLLTARVLELRYQSLDQAVRRLEMLVREGI